MARSSSTLPQLNTLATLAPWVIAMRSWDVFNSSPTARNRELQRMVQEKQAAGMDALFAMGQTFWQMQWQAWSQLATSTWARPQTVAMDPLRMWLESAHFADRLVSTGLRPATRRVRGNVRRLARRKRH